MTAAGLLLAAGEGSRFGGPKALVRLGDETLVDRGVRTLHDGGCAPVLVVLGAAAGDVVATATLRDAIVIQNDGWSEGIGSSLRVGLDALAQLDLPAAVIALADQPSVKAEVVSRLIRSWLDGAVAVVASYDGHPRNPVLLDASVWAEVAALARDDVGARAWLRTHPDRVTSVRCDDIASDADIDTPDDLDRLVEDRP